MEKVNLLHNYVIIGCSGYAKIGFSDIMSLPEVRYFYSHFDGIRTKLDLTITKITFSRKVNRLFNYPFSRYTYSKIYPFKFSNNNPLVFIFFGNTQDIFQSSYISYLKEKYKGAKFVLYMQDLVKRNRKLNFEAVRDRFDLIICYDKGDSVKYGTEYYPTPYSVVKIPENHTIKPIDIYYCGNAKTRGKVIFDIYRKIKNQGLSCKFFITDAPRELRIYDEDIIYDHYISYMENLQYVQKSKCILEVMQVNADGFTPRLWESIAFNRHLLTNNTYLSKTSYYNKDSMHLLSEVDNIKEWINRRIIIDDKIKESMSPIYFLKFVDLKL